MLIVISCHVLQGPLSVFSAKQRWTAPRTFRLKAEDRDLGFTLKGDAPVQIQSLDPLCQAAVSTFTHFLIYLHSHFLRNAYDFLITLYISEILFHSAFLFIQTEALFNEGA